jgi:hypothetical protein
MTCGTCNMPTESRYGHCERTARCKAAKQREIRKDRKAHVETLKAELAALKAAR